jgi:hypothetical protein
MENIIDWCISNKSAMGYFCTVYHRVTLRIKDEIKKGSFEDNDRMAKLDIIFARRYVDALEQFRNKKEASECWKLSFEESNSTNLTALQHIFLGMNAHIIFYLGVAASEVAQGEEIFDLKNDFFLVNEILLSMIDEVQDHLAKIWWPLKVIDILLGRLDENFAGALIRLARLKAWDHACLLALCDPKYLDRAKIELDKDTVDFSTNVTKPTGIIKFVFWLIRSLERKDVSKNIEKIYVSAPGRAS